ncbi:hypothetical protein [Thalassospira mesophila]|uniref:Uncharacterized protein n=1 Tax=Thalassospira mesophila TaxID=1293891 RepID=A0A1Y2L188_9PROT|nr:hypothetical protein [Thalassospira mesophila]OSQ38991.1 hypothetical protein TMES_09855 [Thalassospira mesophila]
MSNPVSRRTTYAERNDALVFASKEFLRWMISQSTEPMLPRDTTPDQYLRQVSTLTRSQRRAMKPDQLALINWARAVAAAQSGEVEE